MIAHVNADTFFLLSIRTKVLVQEHCNHGAISSTHRGSPPHVDCSLKGVVQNSTNQCSEAYISFCPDPAHTIHIQTCSRFNINGVTKTQEEKNLPIYNYSTHQQVSPHPGDMTTHVRMCPATLWMHRKEPSASQDWFKDAEGEKNNAVVLCNTFEFLNLALSRDN